MRSWAPLPCEMKVKIQPIWLVILAQRLEPEGTCWPLRNSPSACQYHCLQPLALTLERYHCLGNVGRNIYSTRWNTIFMCCKGVMRWILSVYVSNLFKAKLNVEHGWYIGWVMESQIYQHLLCLFLFYRIVSIDSNALSTAREAHEASECITVEFSFMVSD